MTRFQRSLLLATLLGAAATGASADQPVSFALLDSDGNWGTPMATPAQALFGPAVTSLDGLPAMAWTQADGGVGVATANSYLQWTRDELLPGFVSSTAPAITTLDGELVLVTSGHPPGNELFPPLYATFIGDSGPLETVQVPNAAPGSAPAAVALDGDLYVAFRGYGGDDQIYTSRYDGANGTWDDWPTPAPTGFVTETAPALTVSDGSLYLAWRGADDNGIYWGRWHDGGWEGPYQVPGGAWTAAAPAMAAIDGALYIAWRGISGDDGLYYSVAGDVATAPYQWGPILAVDGATSTARPGLAALDAGPMLAWTSPTVGALNALMASCDEQAFIYFGLTFSCFFNAVDEAAAGLAFQGGGGIYQRLLGKTLAPIDIGNLGPGPMIGPVNLILTSSTHELENADGTTAADHPLGPNLPYVTLTQARPTAPAEAGPASLWRFKEYLDIDEWVAKKLIFARKRGRLHFQPVIEYPLVMPEGQ